MLKNLLLTAALLLPATALAAPKGVTLSQNKAITVFHGTPGKMHLPKWTPPPGKNVIFSTLGKKNAYDDGEGWTIADTGSVVGEQQWFAMAIVPTADATVTELVEAIGYVTGFDGVTVALYSDAGGIPGKVLAQKVVKKLETFGDCCGVAVDKLAKPVAVTAGTTYWVAATLPTKAESTTWDAWNFSSVNTDSGAAAYNDGSGWVATSDEYPAFAVYGD